MERVAVAVRWVGFVESVAVITAELVPAGPIGVPVIWPAALIASPAGKPVAVKVMGGVPPVAATVVGVYGTPMIPPGKVVVVIAKPWPITMDIAEVLAVKAGLVESVTVIVGLLVPAGPVGVPEIVPAALIESPAGKPVAVKL
jgi:hypothetical protein